MISIPIHTLRLPDYGLDKNPDYQALGKIIDNFLKEKYLYKEICIRGLSLADHSGMSLKKLTQNIIKFGTDKYDPHRKSFWQEWEVYKNKGIDLFLSKCKITKNFHWSHEMLEDFYEGAKEDRGYSIKLDLLVIYDPNQLKMIHIEHKGEIWDDSWKFKYPDKKPEAILSIIHLIKK